MSGIMMALLGAGGGTVRLSNQTIEDSRLSPATATASYTLNLDGTAVAGRSGLGNTTIPQEWWSDSPAGSIGASYEARWTPITGTPSGDATNTWLSLSTGRAWSVSRSGAGSLTVSGTVEIRPTGGSVLASATITLTATVEP